MRFSAISTGDSHISVLYNEIAPASLVHLRCEATYVRKLCLPRRALKVRYRGLQHSLFIRRFRRLPYAIESIVSGDFKEMLSRIEQYGLFLCTSLSAPHWPHCACLVWIALLVLRRCCVAIFSTQCDVANFFFNCQLLIEWHCAKLWEWILIKLLNSFVYIAHTD